MVKKIVLMVTTMIMIVFFSACKSNDNEYDEIIDQVFEEVQKFNDDEDYLYIHGGREESNIYIYELEGHEDEGLIIRVYYPYEEKRTGEKRYDENWYGYEKTSQKLNSVNPLISNKDELIKKFEEINIKENSQYINHQDYLKNKSFSYEKSSI